MVLRYRIYLEQKHAPTTINLPWRPFGGSPTRPPIPDCSVQSWPAGIRRVKGVRRIGVRVGNWLTVKQGKRLLANAEIDSLRGKRNYAILAMLIGCGLRHGELFPLCVDAIQLREEHWVIADLLGKAGHIRTIPIPAWVKAAADAWKEASGITEGTLYVFRKVLQRNSEPHLRIGRGPQNAAGSYSNLSQDLFIGIRPDQNPRTSSVKSY